jgi:transketolase
VIGPQPNREMYGKTLVELGERNPRVVVLDADVAKSTNTYRFRDRFPDRFFDLGSAELNMVCMAAGLATTGLIPFASTFVIFASLRAVEGIRTSIAYPRLNVKIVATNAGVEICGDGVTHQGVEDLAVMRAIANMVVLAPSDPVMTRKATLAIADYDGPVYMRLGRQVAQVLYDESAQFVIGKMIRLRDGEDVTVIACGNMVEQALMAADELARLGIQARVLDCHTIKPIDREEILAAAQETQAIVTAEDHSIVGGLGAAVCEVVAETCPAIVRRIGLRDTFASSGREPAKLLAHYRMDWREIARQAQEAVDAARCAPAARPSSAPRRA